MIIPSRKEQKKSHNNLFRFILLCVVFCFSSLILKAQNKAWYSPSKIGFMYGYGEQGGFLLNDKDYSYSSNLIKLQFYYPLKTGKFSLDLVIEPSLGFAKHQLLNFYFVEPDEPDFLAKREEFTRSKLLTEYILSTNLIIGYTFYKRHSIYALIGWGPMYISKRTERLAKGFAFVENIGLGISTQINKKLYFNITGSYRHLSNAELKQPNSGINIVSLEAGLLFGL